MSRQFLPVSRRRFLQSTTLGAAAAATGILHAPAVLRAQGAPVKVGVLHPVSGALSYSGQQGRIGAVMAIEEINAAGGIKALGGAKIEAVLGAVDAGRRQRRSREDEWGRSRGHRRRLCQRDLPRRQPDRGAL
jgi:hypothetical protein